MPPKMNGSASNTLSEAPVADAKRNSSSLPDSVSHFYYKHGLFLSSYPTCASSIAIVAILFSCYPLINIPLPGTIPTKIVMPYEGKYVLFGEGASGGDRNYSTMVKNIFNVNTNFNYNGNNNISSYEPPFPWAQSSPIFYVQQISFRASVLPWSEDMQLMDAFRAPLYEVFKLIEIIRNHESEENQRTLDQNCLHVENVKRTKNEQIFPEYNCLVLSPANLWSQNLLNFTKDANILNTIFQYHNLQKTKVSTAEMLFGVPMQDTGFKRYPLRARSRIIQYAVTLILKQNDKEYLDTLKEKLLQQYPPPLESRHGDNVDNDSNDNDTSPLMDEKRSITYIFYPGEFRFWEFLPLSIAFVLLFTYVYFSVRKIDVIRSRILLALCSVVTVFGALVMSLGLCFFFGLTISLQSKDIFPYLIVLVGLENCLVITKSVVSTDEKFDVKIRVAQALSKEGWHISKTLMTELTILTIGLATFVPVIQEFCVFAIVGLLSDFMLQMLLFSTILAMNIKRIEYAVEAKHLPKMILSNAGLSPSNTRSKDFRFFSNGAAIGNGGGFGSYGGGTTAGSFGLPFHRSLSHPKLSFADLNGELLSPKRTSIGSSVGNNGQEQRIPKRLKLVNFWARTRFFQRAFMVWMIVWICSIIYNSGYLENLFTYDSNRTIQTSNEFRRHIDASHGAVSNFFSNVQHVWHKTGGSDDSVGDAANTHTVTKHAQFSNDESQAQPNKAEPIDSVLNKNDCELRRLRYPDFELHYFLSNFHWSTIMKQYNMSLSGRYVTILPTIKLSHAISPEAAILVRNPNEKVMQNFQWKALAAALDPLDFNDDEHRRESPLVMPGGTPLVPKSPMEIFFAVMLCCISIFVLCYAMVVFYRCICTRNYAEWRSSWQEDSASAFSQKTEHIFDGVPTRIAGHKNLIECLITDGANIISCCLRGQIKMWDARSGEHLATIDRTDMQIATPRLQDGEQHQQLQQQVMLRHLPHTPIWCMDYFDNLIAVGCANGRIELWELPAGVLKCVHFEDSKRNQGITHIHLNGDRIVVARLCGRLDFYRLETFYKGKQIDWGFTSAYRRTHVRTGSTGSIGLMHPYQQQQQNSNAQQTREQMTCTLESVRLAHQQPITCMEILNGMVFTGSQDHTLKIYSLNDADIEYTLHGHCGPITCLFVDRWQPGTGGSGSQDGMLCVWDLLTGACMFNIQAHDGAVSCLVCAPSYVISLGTDERVCVWERFQGNLLSTISISNAYSSLLMLTPSLLVTSKMGSLIVWDVRTGEPAREVKLDFANLQLCPKVMLLAGDSVVCDYGNEIRLVRFPIAIDKSN